jgi:tetratricopeptide (TPR) repeat protein
MSAFPLSNPSFLQRAAGEGRRVQEGIEKVTAGIAARHCVDLLAEGLEQDPDDPRRSLWLAEALLRMQRDMRTWAWLRTVTDPSSNVFRTAREEMSHPGGDDAAIRLLKTAFYRARSAAAEPVAAHVLARVYLQRGRPQDALRLARLAGSKAPGERRDLLITAALAFVALEQRDDAVRLAERAIEQGSSLGYAVLAPLHATNRSSLSRDPARHAQEWRRLREQVRIEDRVRYHGAARTPAEVALAVRSDGVAEAEHDAVRCSRRLRPSARRDDGGAKPMSEFLPDDLLGEIDLERVDLPLVAGAPTEPVVETEWTATEFFVEWIEPIDGAANLPLADPFQVGVGAAVASWVSRHCGRKSTAAAEELAQLDGGSGRGGG